MAEPCSICTHDRREAIDISISAGTSMRTTAKAFNVSRCAVQRHGANHLHAADIRAEVKKGRARVVATLANIDPEPVKLDTPGDILEQMRWAYGKKKKLFAMAEAASDLRRMETSLSAIGTSLEQFNKSFGVYSDGITVNVNPSAQRLESAISRLTDSELDSAFSALRRGELPTVPGFRETLEGELA